MTSVQANKRGGPAVIAALLCALVASMAFVVAPAAAEEGDAAPIRPISEGGLSFPNIAGPTGPEEFPYQFENVSPELKFRQVSDQLIVVEYFKYGVDAFDINAEAAHAVDGATVPTEIRLSEDEAGPVITLVVHHRAGNPAAGGAPFAYPVTGGEGWEGGFFVQMVGMGQPSPPPAVEPTAPPTPTPCVVPSLPGLTLRTAKAHLRAAHCGVGKVYLGTGASVTKAKVVRQFRAAGTELAAGAPVAFKLGSTSPPITHALTARETIIIKGPPDEAEIREAEEAKRAAEEARRKAEEAERAAAAAATPAPVPPVVCMVPALHDLSLAAAKSRLRTAHCAIGQVHLGVGATAGKGKVVKQFRDAGLELAAGTPVGVKLGAR